MTAAQGVPAQGPDARAASLARALQGAAQTSMYREAGQAAAGVRAQLALDTQRVAELAVELQRFRPRAVVTCARGSSDHAATYARYLVETRMGLLSSSAGPSVSSIYGVRPDLSQCLFLAISQSGRSPDLLAAAQAARQAGALVIAVVNVEDSPLAAVAHHWLPMRAGPEQSVAATKSFICSLSAVLHLVARWAGDGELLDALATAPDQLDQAWGLDWRGLLEELVGAQHLFVLGRGLGLGTAQEVALKLKETSGLHAEAFSSAEVQHGPMALFANNIPALLLCQDDEARAGMQALAQDLAQGGVRILFAGGEAAGVEVLPTIHAHAAIEPLLLAQSFYRVAPALALARGLDPDHPPRLRKVTSTV